MISFFDEFLIFFSRASNRRENLMQTYLFIKKSDYDNNDPYCRLLTCALKKKYFFKTFFRFNRHV